MASYFAMALMDGSKSRHELLAVGELLKDVIIASIATNLLILIASIAMQIKQKIKRWKKKRLTRKDRSQIAMSKVNRHVKKTIKW